MEFLIRQSLSNLYFEQLKEASITAVQGVIPELILIQFLLARSPVLKKMTIVHYGSERLPGESLQQFVPASKDVKIFNLSM